MRYFLLFAFQIILFYQIEGQNISSFFSAFNKDSLIKTVRDLQAKIFISDISGRILFKKDLFQPVNTINLNHLPNGIYLLSLSVKNEMLTRKIVKTQ